MQLLAGLLLLLTGSNGMLAGARSRGRPWLVLHLTIQTLSLRSHQASLQEDSMRYEFVGTTLMEQGWPRLSQSLPQAPLPVK
jgi:hypothetical protein